MAGAKFIPLTITTGDLHSLEGTIPGVETTIYLNLNVIAWVEAADPENDAAGATIHLVDVAGTTTLHTRDALSTVVNLLPPP